MDNKKLLFVSIILMLLMITISSASAGELNADEDLTISEDLSIDNGDAINLDEELEGNAILTSNEELEDNEIVGEGENSEATGNNITPSGNSFTDIQNAINSAGEGDNIILNGTYYQDSYNVISMGNDAVFATSIDVNKSVNIIGINDATLQGVKLTDPYFKQFGLMTILANGVVLKNITFCDGLAISKDGSLQSNSAGSITCDYYSFSIDNCRFLNNEDTDGDWSAGALKLYDSDCNVSNCYFYNNRGSRGGVFLIEGNSQVKFYNTTFEDNHASTFGGGAVCVIDHAKADFTNCSFISNAAANGGAIYAVSDVSIFNCSFVNNTATEGGAIELEYTTSVKISNSSFESNNASNHGGAIYGNCYVANCTFLSNHASQGGAIYGSGVVNCTFINNSAATGGAIFSLSDSSVENCSFVNNSVTEAGGAVYGENLSVLNCTFENNSASTGGGAIHTAGSSNFKGCNFINNSAGNYGSGAIRSFNAVTVSDCLFANNSALNYGGAIDFNYGTISNSTFENNSAGQHGGAIFAKSNVNAVNCIFVNNSAKFGGAIRSNDTLSLENSNFTNNSAQSYGGAINTNNGNAANCNFINNSANINGGVIACNELFTVESSLFECNSANNNGGAICTAACTVNDCTFVNNSAENSGGAINLEYFYLINKKCNISSSEFIDNHASSHGGAISWANENGTITQCNFTNNSAGDSGGAVYLDNNTNSVNITNCDFRNNSVSNNYLGANRGGGAICLIGNNIYIKLCSFISNLASKSNGGAIFLNTSGLTNNLGGKNILSSNSLGANALNNIIEESTFQGNDARTGKAICTEEETIIFFNNFFYTTEDEKTKLVSGMTLDQLSVDNTFTNSKLDSSVNSSDLTLTYDESIIVNVSSVNAKGVNVVIYDKDNNEVFAQEVIANGQFVVPKLAAGNYTANFTTVVEEGLYEVDSCKTQITILPAKSSVSASAVTSYYGKTFSIKPSYSNATSIKYVIKNSAGKQVKSGSISPGASITGLSFVPGTYTLTLTAVVDGNHTSSSASSKITVNKATGNITASALTTYYNSGKTWSITLKDKTNGKVLASKKLTLKVYTGSKYKTYTVKTNSKGVATFKASTLAPGSHKVVVSYSNSNYTTKSLTKTLKINKMALSYKVSKSTQKDGAGLHVWVKNKATGKLINKIKIKLLVYTGKKYKTITLVSAKYSSKGNGYTGYAVKGPVYSIGTHTVKIMAGDSYHTGSAKSSLVLKSTVKKYSKKTITISKGKRTIK